MVLVCQLPHLIEEGSSFGDNILRSFMTEDQAIRKGAAQIDGISWFDQARSPPSSL